MNTATQSEVRRRGTAIARDVSREPYGPNGIALPAEGDLAIPFTAAGLVVFAPGSGSSRFSRRNRHVAEVLQAGGFATLLLDLLTRDEEAIDTETGEYRFDVDRLGRRVVAAIDWTASDTKMAALPVACFGANPALVLLHGGPGFSERISSVDSMRHSSRASRLCIGISVEPASRLTAISPEPR